MCDLHLDDCSKLVLLEKLQPLLTAAAAATESVPPSSPHCYYDENRSP